jgi:hypothetical protein
MEIPLFFNLTVANHEEQLNAHSVYQLPRIETPGMPLTLRLLINDTVRNNQTEIQCDRSEISVSTTTPFVLAKVLALSGIDLPVILTSLIKIVDPVILLTGDTVGMGINLS